MLVLALPVLANANTLLISNPGFEETRGSDGSHPQAWSSANGGEPLRVDKQTAFAGRNSLRLEYRPPFVGSSQSLDAAPWKGRTLVLRARLKGKGLGEGNTGLWLRGDGITGQPIGFASSYQQPLAGTTGWQVRQARLFVSQDTERLMFGAALGAPGTLWVDEFELQVLPVDTTPPSVAARTYLDAALNMIADNAYYSDRVDWPVVRREVATMAAGATGPDETHLAINRALQALGDGHSHLAPRTHVEKAASDPDGGSDGTRAQSLGRVGYLHVPGFAFTNPGRSSAFSTTLRGHLDSQAAAGACGWIIDLRENTGGNMYPMIQGLSGLLGGETLGYFVGREERTPWNARRAGHKDGDLHDLEGGLAAPVAVLQGRRTFSSGEATLLSFVGRANTRRFGEASGGLSTANRMFPLPDGAALVLTTAVMADRSGQVYGGSIEPDEVVPDDRQATVLARQWIEAQPGCKD